MAESKFSDPVLRRMAYIIGCMCTVILGFYTFGLLKNFVVLILNVLMPFIAGFLIAYIVSPVVISLQQRLKFGRITGTLVLFSLIFLALFLLLSFLIPTLVSEIIKLVTVIKEHVPELLVKIADNFNMQIDDETIQKIQEKVMAMDYKKIVGILLPGFKEIAAGSMLTVGKATKGILTSTGALVGFFSFIAFVGIISFYFIVDWEKVTPFVQKMVPPKYREKTFDVLNKIDIAMGGFLRGQMTVSAIVGSMFAVGLFFIGFLGFPELRSFCFLIGTVAAIGGFIPYLGPIIGVTPAILIVTLTGGIPWSTKGIALLSVIILFALIQAIEGFVLQPRIVGKGAGLHPLAVMLALLFGSQFGIGGMIIAVPLASAIRVLILEFYWLPIEKREATLPDRA